nr:MAG TPA: hypothetical protein [Caudoviricetes sp.]
MFHDVSPAFSCILVTAYCSCGRAVTPSCPCHLVDAFVVYFFHLSSEPPTTKVTGF